MVTFTGKGEHWMICGKILDILPRITPRTVIKCLIWQNFSRIFHDLWQLCDETIWEPRVKKCGWKIIHNLQIQFGTTD